MLSYCLNRDNVPNIHPRVPRNMKVGFAAFTYQKLDWGGELPNLAIKQGVKIYAYLIFKV
jgi:hypothetical protein